MPQTYPQEQIEMIKKIVPWWYDSYDKIQVEQIVMGWPDLPGTILRLPMIYGPGDYARGFQPVLKRIDDNRPAILYEQGWAAWRAPRGYVENVAAALALARIPPTCVRLPRRGTTPLRRSSRRTVPAKPRKI
jgi:nucleoside-diphosphate-sugar epimerase